jgi:GTP-sensing pleiotropic transcriptional regulator CodY
MDEAYGEKTPEEVLDKVIELFDDGDGNGVDADLIADTLGEPRYVVVNHLIDLRDAGSIDFLRDGADQTCIVTGIRASGRSRSSAR